MSKPFLFAATKLMCFACWGIFSPQVANANVHQNPKFWQHWGDGQAEVATYEYRIQRYGEHRKGSAIAIFVTETFSKQQRVKVEANSHSKSDQLPVMKLNLVRDFQTGIYDYNTMLSTFISLEPALGRPKGTPLKTSFVSTEWCGNTFQQTLFQPRFLRVHGHSYFAGEADFASKIAWPQQNTLSEDALLLWARQMLPPYLEPGEQQQIQLLLSSQKARLDHQPVTWVSAITTRSEQTQNQKTPLGMIPVDTYTLTLPTRDIQIVVEHAWPHRIISWHDSSGESAILKKVERLKYWLLNSQKGKKNRAELGVPNEAVITQ